MAGAVCTITVTESKPGRGMPTNESGVCSRCVGWRSLRVCPRLYMRSALLLIDGWCVATVKVTQKCQAGGERIFHILRTNGLVGMMADAARTAQKDHCAGNPLRQNHGIVAGAAYHGERFDPYAADRLLRQRAQACIHGHRWLVHQHFTRRREAAPFGNRRRLGEQVIHSLVASRLLSMAYSE